MLSVRNSRFIKSDPDGKTVILAELDIDTSGELPDVDDIEGCRLYQGSTALIITEGKIAILGGDGSWYINGEVIS